MAQLEDRIASLKAKKDALASRLNRLQAKAKTDERKRDTRRKIVVGAAVLAAMEKDSSLALKVRELLRHVVTREADREVIAGLLAPPAAPSPAPAASMMPTQRPSSAPVPVASEPPASKIIPPATPASTPRVSVRDLASLDLLGQ
jgi:hypothetical protein